MVPHRPYDRQVHVRPPVTVAEADAIDPADLLDSALEMRHALLRLTARLDEVLTGIDAEQRAAKQDSDTPYDMLTPELERARWMAITLTDLVNALQQRIGQL